MKFKRQVPIGTYITDFAALNIKVVVEVDGAHHGDEDHQVYDAERDAYLQSEGYVVIRLWAKDVLINLDGCVQHIKTVVDERKRITSPWPSP